MNRILVIGKGGQVGFELLHSLAAAAPVSAVDLDEMDLSDPDSIRRKVREIRPDLIINAAAYTAVDLAESQPLPCIRRKADLLRQLYRTVYQRPIARRKNEQC